MGHGLGRGDRRGERPCPQPARAALPRHTPQKNLDNHVGVLEPCVEIQRQ